MSAAVLLLSLTACGPGTDRASAPVVRDSAGIAIVENGPGAGDPAWAEVRVVPDLEIGAQGAADGVQFGQVVDLDVDSGGRIYALDQLERVVRVFEAEGTPRPPWGRGGEGPGELSRLASGVLVDGDAVIVVDWAQRRLSRFTADGGFLDMATLPLPGGTRSWWQRAPDGTLRARVLRRLVNDAGRWSGADVLVAIPATLDRADTLLTFDYAETDIGAPGAIRAALIINTPAWTVLPDGSIAWTALDLPELRVHDRSGRRVRIVRNAAWAARPADDADHARLITLLGDRLEMLGGSRASIRQLDIPPVAFLPVLTSVLAGPHGTLWVQRAGTTEEFHPMSINAPEFPHGLGGTAWDVLDMAGRLLTTLTLPRGVQIIRVREDALYGVRRDSLGVESLVRLRLLGLP